MERAKLWLNLLPFSFITNPFLIVAPRSLLIKM